MIPTGLRMPGLLGLAPSQGVGVTPPAGYAFLLFKDGGGNYQTLLYKDANGDYQPLAYKVA